MATRFYFPLTEAAPVTPPAPSADWEHVNSLQRKALTTPDLSALTTAAYTPDAADHLVNGDAHHRQYVTDPLAAQTLSGNVKAQFQILEANAANNLFLTLKIYVISNDGTTTKESVLVITRDTTNEAATSLTNRNFPSTAIATPTLEAGDRLCIEVGLGGTPTAAGGTQGHNGSIRWGCDASSGDLPEDDTTTATTWRGWLEFSGTLTFQGTEFSQTVGGHTLGPTSTQTKGTAKTAGGFSEGPLASLSTLLSHNVTVGGYTEGPVASVLRQTGKSAGGFTEGPLGTLQKAAAKTAGGYSLGPSGALARAVSLLGMGDFAEAPVGLLARLTSKQAGGYVLAPTGTLQAELQGEPQLYFQETGGFVVSPAGTLAYEIAGPMLWSIRHKGARR